ncbi:MAG: hypothetical protein ACI4AM_06490 [Muribaculaceae bacterium]
MQQHSKLKVILTIILAMFAMVNLMAVPLDTATIAQSITVIVLTKAAAILAFRAMLRLNRT